MRVYGGRYRRRRQRVGLLLLSVLAVLALAGAAPEVADEALGEAAGRQAGQTDAGPGNGGAEGTEDAAGTDGEEAREEADEGGATGGPGGQADAGPQIPVPTTNDLWMTIPKMGLYDDYVANSKAPAAMDRDAIKLPSTAFPWQRSANTYIAAHRIGYPGTGSDYQFYDLPNLALGDRI